jgi:hypothetical protein
MSERPAPDAALPEVPARQADQGRLPNVEKECQILESERLYWGRRPEGAAAREAARRAFQLEAERRKQARKRRRFVASLILGSALFGYLGFWSLALFVGLALHIISFPEGGPPPLPLLLSAGLIALFLSGNWVCWLVVLWRRPNIEIPPYAMRGDYFSGYLTFWKIFVKRDPERST